MNKILLALQGYKKIDQVRGLWKTTHVDFEGREVNIAQYSLYDVYYNPKEDKYKILTGGLLPMNHTIYFGLTSIVNFLNHKIEEIEGKLWNYTSSDYFELKTEMMEDYRNVGKPYEQVSGDSTIVVVLMKLETDRDDIMSLKDSSPELLEALKMFKSSPKYKKLAEVYEETENIIVTSEGYYIATYKETFNEFINSREDEDEEED